MNANELANELSACFTKADWEYVDETVNILRQFGLAESIIKQQKLEIEALLRFISERGETGQLIIWKAEQK